MSRLRVVPIVVVVALLGACGSDTARSASTSPAGEGTSGTSSTAVEVDATLALEGRQLEVERATCLTEDQELASGAVVTLELEVDATGDNGDLYVVSAYRTDAGDRTDDDIFLEVQNPDVVEEGAYLASAHIPVDEPLIVENRGTFTIEANLEGFELEPVAMSLQVDCSPDSGD